VQREPVGRPDLQADGPNELWTADFKGQFRTGDRQVCYPLTIADRFSRYLLACRGLVTTSYEAARRTFERAFETYGLPRRILTDGGSPFAGTESPRRLSRLSLWWVDLGIEPVRIQPGHPEQNGSHERMHRTLKAQTARPPAASLAAQQRRFDAFRTEYNEERPHEALAGRTPRELYEGSPRAYARERRQAEYPGHYEVRAVKSCGEIRWHGKPIFISRLFYGNKLGLTETDEGVWSVFYGQFLLGRYDERVERFRSI